MSFILLTSITICLFATGGSLYLLWRLGDWHLAFLAAMTALVGTEQARCQSLDRHICYATGDRKWSSGESRLTPLVGLRFTPSQTRHKGGLPEIGRLRGFAQGHDVG